MAAKSKEIQVVEAVVPTTNDGVSKTKPSIDAYRKLAAELKIPISTF